MILSIWPTFSSISLWERACYFFKNTDKKRILAEIDKLIIERIDIIQSKLDDLNDDFNKLSIEVNKILSDLSLKISSLNYNDEKDFFGINIERYEYGNFMSNSINFSLYSKYPEAKRTPTTVDFIYNEVFKDNSKSCNPICISYEKEIRTEEGYDFEYITANIGNGLKNYYSISDFMDDFFEPILKKCNKITPVLFNNVNHSAILIIKKFENNITLYYFDPNGKKTFPMFMEFLRTIQIYSRYNIEIIHNEIVCENSMQHLIIPEMFKDGYCLPISNLYVYVLLSLIQKGYEPFESNINIVCKLIINYLDRNLGKNKYATNFVVNFIIYITDQFMNQMKQFDSMTSSDKKILSDMVKGVKKFISEEAYNDDKEDKREVYEMVRYRYDKAIISSSSYSLKTYADFMYRVILQYKPSKER